MKKRQQKILKYILDGENGSIEEIRERFKISKRTLYYDIEDINYYLRNQGQIKNIDHHLCYVGSLDAISTLENASLATQMDANERYTYILYKILNQDLPSIQQLEKKLNIGRNTIVETLHRIRDDLKQQHLVLTYQKGYVINGSEEKIRDIFIGLMYEDNNLMSQIDDDVLAFNEQNHLELSDFSLGLLSKYLTFVRVRLAGGNVIEVDFYQKVCDFTFYENVSTLLASDQEREIAYLAAFISSLTSLKSDEKTTVVDQGIDRLIHRFEVMSAVDLEEKVEFRKSIRRHLLSSYYRIKFKFPIKNLNLAEIKQNHAALFTIVKTILEDEQVLPEFKGIREEEIAFLTAYFGGYLKTINTKRSTKNKVLIVCPHGLMVSKTLEIQLYQNIPMIEVVDAISYQQLATYDGVYDYIISTIDIPTYEHVIKVNPMLSKHDIQRLMEACLVELPFKESRNTDAVLAVIKENCIIEDEEKLIKELEKLLNKRREELYQPMLKELISEERIQIIPSCEDWKAAIRIAAQPLLEDGSIEASYIDQMIQSIKDNGPYIVLAERFALPHASNVGGVNHLAMSFLIVEQEVDLLGKPVNVFAVLAPIDSTTHLKALASLAELFYDKENLDAIRVADKATIMKILSK